MSKKISSAFLNFSHFTSISKVLNKVYYYYYDVSTYSISYKLKIYNEENFQIYSHGIYLCIKVKKTKYFNMLCNYDINSMSFLISKFAIVQLGGAFLGIFSQPFEDLR